MRKRGWFLTILQTEGEEIQGAVSNINAVGKEAGGER